MRRDNTRPGPILGIAAAGCAVAAMSLAGCGGSSSTASGAPAPSSAAAAAASGSSSQDSSPSGSLKSSTLYGLTQLKQAQLCGLLSGGEPAQILGTPTVTPTFANRLGLGITCEWMQSAGSSTELYIGISTIIDWQGAQAVDKLLTTSSVTIDGHPALAADKQHGNDWAQLDVALGGDHDPVAEYRAPALAAATKLATTVTPRLIALNGS